MLNPAALWWLWLLPVLAVVAVVRFFRSWRIYSQLGGSTTLRGVFALRHFGKDFTLMQAVLFMVGALSDSYWGSHLLRENHSGIELVFAIDISRSMLAEDGPGKRLNVAKTLANELVFGIRDPQIGVVLFKGQAFSALPLTNDREMIAEVLSAIDTSWISAPGTNVSDALKQAGELFSPDNQAERIIVLFSDGENTVGNVTQELRWLFHNKIKVYALGIGDPNGTLAPDEQGNPRMNSDGQVLRSALNPSLLKNIAFNSNGAYFWAGDSNDLEQLKKSIKENESKSIRMVQQKRSLFGPLVLLAMLSLAGNLVIRSWSWKKLFGAREYQ
jgi:Ca-activated chloride channel homolog